MPHAELNAAGDRVDITSEYREREALKAVPGTKWDANGRIWTAPISWATCVQLRGQFGTALQVGPRLGAWARQEAASRVTPCLAMRTATDAPEIPSMPFLRPHQRVAVRFMATAGSALNADDMGLGKTLETIGTLEELERQAADAVREGRSAAPAYPALVVCPNAVKRAWVEEFARWAPHRRVVEVGGSAAKRRVAIAALAAGEADVAVINYEALRSHTRLAGYGNMALTDTEREPKELNDPALRLGTVVADEAHRIKEPKAKQTRALWWIGDQAAHRFALTGTPIADAPDDLWSLMRFVAPHEWTSKTRYVSRYAIESWNLHGFRVIQGLKGETSAELFKYLDPRFIRRTKGAVLADLPPKQYVRRYAEMAPKQQRAYEAMRKAMVVELDGGVLAAASPLAKLTRLMQFASALGEMVDNGRKHPETGDPVLDLVLTEPSCKVDALLDVADELGDKQAIVFAESKQLIDMALARLAKAGATVGAITGSVPLDERADAVTAFQAGRLQFMCCTMAAGGTGLTLTAADTSIFLQRSFNLILDLQAEDRNHRIGQEAESVTIVDIITPGTVDEAPHEVMAAKLERLQEIVRDAEGEALWQQEMAHVGPDADTLARWLQRA